MSVALAFPSVVSPVSHDSGAAILLRRRRGRNIAHPDRVVSSMMGGASIDGRALVGVILRYVRGRGEVGKIRNKVFGVVKLVGTDRDSVAARLLLNSRCDKTSPQRLWMSKVSLDTSIPAWFIVFSLVKFYSEPRFPRPSTFACLPCDADSRVSDTLRHWQLRRGNHSTEQGQSL